MDLSQRYRWEENIPAYLDVVWRHEQNDLYMADLILSAGVAWNKVGVFSLVLDSGELSEDTIHDGCLENDRSRDAFIREGYFESYFLDSAGVAFKVGQQHLIIGEGYILDDFLLTGQVGFNLNRILGWPGNLYATVAKVGGSSIYSQLRAVRPLNPYERISVSLGWLHDTEGFLAELLEDVDGSYPGRLPWSGYELETRSDLFWLTFSLNKMFHTFLFSAVGIVEGGVIHGRAEQAGRTARSTIPSLGYLVDLQVEKNITDNFSVQLYWLMASGDGDPVGKMANGELLETYLAIVPFITRTNIFFNGGINETFSNREFHMAGHTARGFCVPGTVLEYYFTDRIYAVGKAAYLFSLVDPPAWSRGRTYGWEVDLMGFWEIGKYVLLSFEGDVFFPGSFFQSAANPDPNTAYRIMVGLDLFFEFP